jgi:hypothetical protein
MFIFIVVDSLILGAPNGGGAEWGCTDLETGRGKIEIGSRTRDRSPNDIAFASSFLLHLHVTFTTKK